MLQRTAVAMSGGVDSSAAALLLQREGPAPAVTGEDAARVVEESHDSLDRDGGH